MSAMLQQTLQTLLAHRLRSSLAVIAIVWGDCFCVGSSGTW